MVISVWGTSATAHAGDAEEQKQEKNSKGEVSPSLGGAVPSVLKGVALHDALKTTEKFRSMFRHVEVEFLTPGNGRDHPSDAFVSFGKKEIDFITYGDSKVVLADDTFLPQEPWQVFCSKIRLGCSATIKLEAAVSNTIFLTDISINRHQNLYLDFQWDLRFAEGFTVSLMGSIGKTLTNTPSYTIEDCSTLTGDTVETLLAKCELGALVGNDHAGPVTQFDPVPVNLKQLEKLWRLSRFLVDVYGHIFSVGFHLEVNEIVLSSAVIKKKCLLL